MYDLSRVPERLLPLYFSREMFYYAMGNAEGAAKQDSAARVAFQNTVTENLGFYMAHLHLASQALAAGHPADAIVPLRAAITDDPYFALPYFYLGLTREAVHDTAGSRDSYRNFIAHAARGDTLRATARRALVRLGGT